ncbi:efflux RND transporter permease subunit, partial [Candidatus Saccharibacteria bacterium]|nr:efflux RND transporter permease subunit [Candidatus Saccharibacteria bacterium]
LQDELVKDVLSSSNDQGAQIRISFEDGTDVQASLDNLKERVKGELPNGGEVVYVRVNAGKLTAEGADLLVSVHGSSLTAEELDAAARRLEPIIKEKVPLARSTHLYPLIETAQNPQTGEEVSTQVRFDRYFDRDTPKALSSVAIGVVGVDNVDQLELYDQTAKALNSESAQDIGADAEIAVDFAGSIRSQVSGLQRNLFEGLIVVLIVSFVLISLRASIVTALSMASTVIITVGILYGIGYTVNTITLFSLVLCLALIVDDTTIVVEAIDAGLAKGKKFREVVAVSLRKVVRASATGTLTTMLAFAPMLFIGGILGEFIRAIPITIIISLAVSLVSSFIFIPLLMRVSYGARTSSAERRRGLVHHAETFIGNQLATLLIASTKTKFRSLSTKLHALLFAGIVIVSGFMIFKTVEFNIFPAPKDSIELQVNARLRSQESSTIELTEKYADSMLESVSAVLQGDLEKATLLTRDIQANRNSFGMTLTLNSIKDRYTTSVEYAQKIQNKLEREYPEFKITAESAGVGPPAGNFTAQIRSDDDQKARVLARDIQSFLRDTVLTRLDGSEAKLKDVTVTPESQVSRDNGARVVNVTAGFSDKDVSALVDLAQKAVEKEFTDGRVASYGLDKNALQFDFGQEEENQKSFESMGKAAIPLFFGMLIVMALLFRSVMQSVLILTALPFAFFGVAAGLALTNNPVSFFTMMGVFALVGISVNNAILLTDYANQAHAEGLPPQEAMASAIRARLRPLITTSITGVLALLPLALDDPFWEGIAFTIVFGLLSSTFLVVTVFPYFYLIEECLRARLHTVIRR